MSVGSLCQVCESASAETSCDQCGRQVCRDHYDRTRGLCAVCGSVGDDAEAGTGTGSLSGPGADDAGPGTHRQ